MRKLILSLLAVAMFAPAAMANEKDGVTYRKSTSEARMLDVSPMVTPTPLTVKIDVIGKRLYEKIELTQEELSKRIINNNYSQTVQNLRVYAAFKVSEMYGCDLIVGARFNIEISDKGGFVEIYGYPANFSTWGGKGDAELKDPKEIKKEVENSKQNK